MSAVGNDSTGHDATQVRRPSRWLRGRLRALEPSISAMPAEQRAMIVVLPLTPRPDGVEVDVWDRSCDRCGAFVPSDPDGPVNFYTGHYSGSSSWGGQVLVVLGLCSSCNLLEDNDPSRDDVELAG